MELRQREVQRQRMPRFPVRILGSCIVACPYHPSHLFAELPPPDEVSQFEDDSDVFCACVVPNLAFGERVVE